MKRIVRSVLAIGVYAAAFVPVVDLLKLERFLVLDATVFSLPGGYAVLVSGVPDFYGI